MNLTFMLKEQISMLNLNLIKQDFQDHELLKDIKNSEFLLFILYEIF